MDYCIVYGMFFGVVRSQVFILYFDDVDVVIFKVNNDKYDNFLLMQQILGFKYFVVWKINFLVFRVYLYYVLVIEVNI